jgi:hypothetical protein
MTHTTSRLGGPLIAAMMLLTGMASLVAVSGPASAHSCSGTTEADCGGCSTGDHSHSWSQPTSGSCSSSCYVTNPLCYLDGGLGTYPGIHIRRLGDLCDGNSRLNYMDGTAYNLDGFGGRSLTMSTAGSSAFRANLAYYHFDGVNCRLLGQAETNGAYSYGTVPRDANVLYVESNNADTASWFSSGTYHIEIQNNGGAT